MFQTFTAENSPEQGPPRLIALRRALADAGVQGFLVPRADAWQGEYVAPRDARLAWLTGFSGSAGFCIVLPGIAGVFVDGRYRLQVRQQVAPVFTPVDWPEVSAGDWLRDHLSEGVVAFDPWLHTAAEIAAIEKALQGHPVRLQPTENFVDAVWHDQPGPAIRPAFAHPEELAGESSAAKRARLGAALAAAGQATAVLTLPDSICWLLNIRGADLPRNPLVQSFALLHADGSVDLFAHAAKFSDALLQSLGAEVRLAPEEDFAVALTQLKGPVRVDRGTAPWAVQDLLSHAGVSFVWGDDPCRLPKACKNAAEIAATREAHLRDGAAIAEFLCWFDGRAEAVCGGAVETEIGVVTALEGFRRATNQLHDLSFETISGAGPNGAVIHYRVSEDSNRRLEPNSLMLVDSGGQYKDGTTDITRTMAIGTPPEGAARAFTAVLQGMIAVSRARFPAGVAGCHLDALARAPLWTLHCDYDHGTGHGVGAFLCVHEGPQRLSRVSDVPFLPGMILSNEPGYYREGAYGIRLENLIVVREAAPLAGGDAQRRMYDFETLTWAPFDRRLILVEELSRAERDWLDAYHAEVLAKIGPRVSAEVRAWLERACAPL
ncbi:aminopeptidase P family protein [Falsigemmobacter intermedius]|uniref:Aminopeptidase P family protein n=1 Tax=Falsigemmobacter intermedius TaxID=1553448 RepID=A0A3S3UE53_9RHOB|nr:aminopeptidase P family protein [Falsigemmobacter intermedius]RWY44595.1 aminopeptidase P family protein [Falsigemmobacter intermedius]